MNKLCALKIMGFKISWNLIYIGLFGNGEIPPLLTHDETEEHLDALLTDNNEQTNDVIALICAKDTPEKFNSILRELADKEASDTVIQKRKWRAYLLKDLLDNISKDCLQGLLELMEFWVTMGTPYDCPQTFPINNDIKVVQEYFSQASYEFNVNSNRVWLNEEILSIVKLEGQ